MEQSEGAVGRYIEQGLAYAEKSRDVRIEESRGAWLFLQGDRCMACVLGLAVVGKYGDLQTAWNEIDGELKRDYLKKKSLLQIFAEFVGCDMRLARAIVYAHANGMNAAAIADTLQIGRLPLSPADR